MASGTETAKTEPRRPPYLPWSTVSTFIGRLSATALPPKIDKSLMPTMSGAVQGHLISALKFLGMLDGDGRVTERLRKLVKAHGNTDAWREELRDLLGTAYDMGDRVDLDTGTSAQLRAAFRDVWGVDGEMVEKATRFYLAAMDAADLKYSPHFKTRAANGPPRPMVLGRLVLRTKPKDTPRREPPGALDTPKDCFMIPFPLRPGLSLPIPQDLKRADVERLTQILMSYVTD
jgi:hypothetical protein